MYPLKAVCTYTFRNKFKETVITFIVSYTILPSNSDISIIPYLGLTLLDVEQLRNQMDLNNYRILSVVFVLTIKHDGENCRLYKCLNIRKCKYSLQS